MCPPCALACRALAPTPSVTCLMQSLPYGLVTLIHVPLLLPSTSWLAADWYACPGIVTFLTVKITVPIFFLSPGNRTIQVPLPPPSPVPQVFEFNPLRFQLPVTVAPLTRL